MMIKEALLVGGGGFAGSILRYVISAAMAGACAPCYMPLGTLTVNASGSLLIGIFLAVAGQGGWYFLLIAGFCGGYTTFSTFSAELFNMVKAGSNTQAAVYVAASVLICVTAVWIGMTLGQKIKIQ